MIRFPWTFLFFLQSSFLISDEFMQKDEFCLQLIYLSHKGILQCLTFIIIKMLPFPPCRNQGVISGSTQVEISKWFGELESTFYKHPRSPHPDVFRVSNDENEGCTGVGRTGWHIDGSFQPAPFSYSLYHIVHTPKKGDTGELPCGFAILL